MGWPGSMSTVAGGVVSQSQEGEREGNRGIHVLYADRVDERNGIHVKHGQTCPGGYPSPP